MLQMTTLTLDDRAQVLCLTRLGSGGDAEPVIALASRDGYSQMVDLRLTRGRLVRLVESAQAWLAAHPDLQDEPPCDRRDIVAAEAVVDVDELIRGATEVGRRNCPREGF